MPVFLIRTDRLHPRWIRDLYMQQGYCSIAGDLSSNPAASDTTLSPTFPTSLVFYEGAHLRKTDVQQSHRWDRALLAPNRISLLHNITRLLIRPSLICWTRYQWVHKTTRRGYSRKPFVLDSGVKRNRQRAKKWTGREPETSMNQIQVASGHNWWKLGIYH